MHPKAELLVWAAKRGGRWAAFSIAALLLAGCGQREVTFILNREGRPTLAMQRQRLTEPADVQKLEGRVRHQEEALRRVLYVMFGTPDQPHAWAPSGLDQKKLIRAGGPADDKHNGLYRKHCAHCHGVSGDGAGPTAQFLNPFPRDYRQGKFKFKSTAPLAAMPTGEDLKRTIRLGINGTAMPAFNVLLREDEIDALAEYVMYLSMRGLVETEMQGVIDDVLEDSLKEGLNELAGSETLDERLSTLITNSLAPPQDDTEEEQPERKNVYDLVGEVRSQAKIDLLNDSLPTVISQMSPDVFNRWKNAEKQVFTPPERDEAMEKLIAGLDGKEIFLGEFTRRATDKKEKGEVVKVECMKCHGPTGLGDGPQLNFDDWNVKKYDALTKEGRSEEDIDQMWRLPIQRIKPRNLRLGVFRGGRRPVDVYRRIAVGINGTPMPAHAALSPQDTKNLQPAEIWALVDYLLYRLPYEEGGELQRQAERASPHRERL